MKAILFALLFLVPFNGIAQDDPVEAVPRSRLAAMLEQHQRDLAEIAARDAFIEKQQKQMGQMADAALICLANFSGTKR